MKRNPNPRAHPTLKDAVSVTRFWNLVQKGEPDACWPWLGDTDRNGYGVFLWRGKRAPAHSLALSFTTGEVRLPGLDTCHSCDNPPCCNPAHLRFDTRAGNMADASARQRAANGNTLLTPEKVRLIRERRAAGARQSDLARDFGVGEGSISLIVRGRQWKNAGGPIQTERKYHRGR